MEGKQNLSQKQAPPCQRTHPHWANQSGHEPHHSYQQDTKHQQGGYKPCLKCNPTTTQPQPHSTKHLTTCPANPHIRPPVLPPPSPNPTTDTPNAPLPTAPPCSATPTSPMPPDMSTSPRQVVVQVILSNCLVTQTRPLPPHHHFLDMSPPKRSPALPHTSLSHLNTNQGHPHPKLTSSNR